MPKKSYTPALPCVELDPAFANSERQRLEAEARRHPGNEAVQAEVAYGKRFVDSVERNRDAIEKLNRRDSHY